MSIRRFGINVVLVCLGLAGPMTTVRAQLDPFATSDPDTVFLFGGPGTLEGRFETAAGAPDWQGWTTSDLYDRSHWQVSTFNAGNLNATPGNHALWCGRTSEQEPSWATAPGYGTNRNDWLIWKHRVPDPGATTTVRLEFVYHHDTQVDHDFFSVAWDSAGTWRTLLRVDGSNRDVGGAFLSPVVFDRTVVYPANAYGGLDQDEVRLRLHVETDGEQDDDDGLADTDGAAQVDDIGVWIDGVLVSRADFEPEGSDGGWIAHDGHAPGDFTKILSGFDDQGLDPDRDNPTPALTIVDDGTPLPNLPDAAPTAGTTAEWWDYGFPGGWVVDHHRWISVRAESPAFPWEPSSPLDPAFDRAFIRADAWGHRDYFRHLPGVTLSVRSFPDPETGGWSAWSTVWSGTFVELTSRWLTLEFPVTDFLVAEPESVRIGVGLSASYIQFAAPARFTPSPVVDNVSLARVRTPAVSAPRTARDLVLHGGHPNPFNPRTEISFDLAREAFVVLDVFDVSGSRVRRIVDGIRPAGSQSVVWDGKDGQGEDVASGVYFVRASASGIEATSKLVLVR